MKPLWVFHGGFFLPSPSINGLIVVAAKSGKALPLLAIAAERLPS